MCLYGEMLFYTRAPSSFHSPSFFFIILLFFLLSSDKPLRVCHLFFFHVFLSFFILFFPKFKYFIFRIFLFKFGNNNVFSQFFVSQSIKRSSLFSFGLLGHDLMALPLFLPLSSLILNLFENVFFISLFLMFLLSVPTFQVLNSFPLFLLYS